MTTNSEYILIVESQRVDDIIVLGRLLLLEAEEAFFGFDLGHCLGSGRLVGSLTGRQLKVVEPAVHVILKMAM